MSFWKTTSQREAEKEERANVEGGAKGRGENTEKTERDKKNPHHNICRDDTEDKKLGPG